MGKELDKKWAFSEFPGYRYNDKTGNWTDRSNFQPNIKEYSLWGLSFQVVCK